MNILNTASQPTAQRDTTQLSVGLRALFLVLSVSVVLLAQAPIAALAAHVIA